ncbi:MAG: hypothetical protein HYY56_04020, partial [Candidatus Omnitrophica bacterium]|nr:hypothetical protein [Candidatus Omnitrophota bacterium]
EMVNATSGKYKDTIVVNPAKMSTILAPMIPTMIPMKPPLPDILLQ